MAATDFSLASWVVFCAVPLQLQIRFRVCVQCDRVLGIHFKTFQFQEAARRADQHPAAVLSRDIHAARAATDVVVKTVDVLMNHRKLQTTVRTAALSTTFLPSCVCVSRNFGRWLGMPVALLLMAQWQRAKITEFQAARDNVRRIEETIRTQLPKRVRAIRNTCHSQLVVTRNLLRTLNRVAQV